MRNNKRDMRDTRLTEEASTVMAFAWSVALIVDVAAWIGKAKYTCRNLAYRQTLGR
jgi:hypothetical protein